MDGTLGDTFPVIFPAFRAAFAKHAGRIYTDLEITRFFGPAETGVFKEYFPEQWRECLVTYLDEYELVHPRHARLFPGIEPALDRLRRKGIRLAIVTGKCPESLEITLRFFGIRHYFEAIETGTDYGPDKPAAMRRIIRRWGFSGREIAYLGDTVYDILASREAGVRPLSAGWSDQADRAALLQANPEKLFQDTGSFLGWIESDLDSFESNRDR